MSLLHAEYLKISKRRLYPMMLLILAIFVGLAAFFLLAFGQIAPEIAEEVPILERPGAYAVGAQQVAGQTWFGLILAVVIVGGEFSTTAWATALTRDARKPVHILSRLIVFVAASWLAMLLATAGWAVLVTFVSPGEGGPGLSGWIEIGWKLGLIQLAWVALGMGAIAMLRSIGPAIGVAIGFSFIESLLGLWGPYERISLTAASTGLFQAGDLGFISAFVPGADLSTLHSVLIVIGWSIFGVLLTWVGVQRRDA